MHRIVLCVIGLLAAGTAAQDLKPGAILNFQFPELPDTLFTMKTGTKVVPQMSVRLPDNYTPDRKFPVFVFLHGNPGGKADSAALGKLRAIMKDQDFILVNVPLFKKDIDKSEIFDGCMISFADYPVIKKCYDAMLGKLFATVPNSDPEKSVFGGFSNGGHATAVLVCMEDEILLKHFKHIFINDGGFFHLPAGLHRRTLADKNFLLLVGDSGNPWWRQPLMDLGKSMDAMARAYKRNLTLIVMEKTEHAFPPRYEAELRAWVYRMNGDTVPATQPVKP